eukprot:c13400_g1_i1 orf=50-268(-)
MRAIDPISPIPCQLVLRMDSCFLGHVPLPFLWENGWPSKRLPPYHLDLMVQGRQPVEKLKNSQFLPAQNSSS